MRSCGMGRRCCLREAPYYGICYSGEELPLEQCGLAVPSEPKNIVAVGLNYRSHAEEIKMELTKEPLIFSKWISSMLDPEGTIIKPRVCKQLDGIEAELAFVVKKKCKEDQARGCRGIHTGLYLPERCNGTRPAGSGRPVVRVAAKDLAIPFSVRSDRGLKLSSIRKMHIYPGRSQRKSCAGYWKHEGFYFRCFRAARIHQWLHDALSRGCRNHRNGRGDRADQSRAMRFASQ